MSDAAHPNPAPHSGQANESLAVAVILACVFVLLVVHTIVARWRGADVELERLPHREFEFRLDVNKATTVELLHLPEIGPKLAARIIADRQANGPFRDLADLGRVPGIGPKTLDRVAPYLRWPDQTPIP